MSLTPVRSIRRYCLSRCSRITKPKEVRECGEGGCPLHLYRLGRNPNRKGIGGRPRKSAS